MRDWFAMSQSFTKTSSTKSIDSSDLKGYSSKGELSRNNSLSQEPNSTVSSSATSTYANLSLHDILDLFQLKVFYVVLLLFDTYIALIEVYMAHEIMPEVYADMKSYRSLIFSFTSTSKALIIYNAICSFSNFAMGFFILEMLLRVYANGQRTLTHPGYLLEIATLSAEIALELCQFGKLSRVLHIFGLWRIYDLILSMRVMDRKRMQELTTALDKAQSIAHKLEEELEIDRDERLAIEKSFKSYREEVDLYLNAERDELEEDGSNIEGVDGSYADGILVGSLNNYNEDFGVSSPKSNQFGLRSRQGSKA
jgi:hypothetical protein